MVRRGRAPRNCYYGCRWPAALLLIALQVWPYRRGEERSTTRNSGLRATRRCKEEENGNKWKESWNWLLLYTSIGHPVTQRAGWLAGWLAGFFFPAVVRTTSSITLNVIESSPEVILVINKDLSQRIASTLEWFTSRVTFFSFSTISEQTIRRTTTEAKQQISRELSFYSFGTESRLINQDGKLEYRASGST